MGETAKREFDLVLYGATGFTGRLVAEYLVQAAADAGVRWALAGRNLERLQTVRAELARAQPQVADLPLAVADSSDPASLADLAPRTSVICSTVGPYGRYGSPLVAACAAAGTDYCDLSGEVPWMQRMVEAHHDEAHRTGARIVLACGFDSVPSDLGTWMLQEHALAAHGTPAREVELWVLGARGGFSGGTLASLAETLDSVAADPAARRAAADPYALNPPGDRVGPDGREQRGVRRVRGVWTGPFVMATINERVVRRSNALSGHRYGRDFRYHEAVRFGRGGLGALRAHGFTLGLGAFAAAMSARATRRVLERLVLPKPGEGPSKERIARGHFELALRGEGADAQGHPFVVDARVAGEGDPGYGATARLLGEAALHLATAPGSGGGVLTPAVALGGPYLERLRGAGFRFEVVPTD